MEGGGLSYETAGPKFYHAKWIEMFSKWAFLHIICDFTNNLWFFYSYGL